jgi:hypothetical protein
MNWRISLTFVALATLATLLSGWLIGSKLLPISGAIEYSDTELKFMQTWINVAIAIGLALPIAVWLDQFKASKPRTILGFYLLILVIQIVTEIIVGRVWLRSLVVIIGTLYTLFRVWQLWQGLQWMKTTQRSEQRYVRGILWVLMLFWSSNLFVLFSVGWLNIL